MRRRTRLFSTAVLSALSVAVIGVGLAWACTPEGFGTPEAPPPCRNRHRHRHPPLRVPPPALRRRRSPPRLPPRGPRESCAATGARAERRLAGVGRDQPCRRRCRVGRRRNAVEQRRAARRRTDPDQRPGGHRRTCQGGQSRREPSAWTVGLGELERDEGLGAPRRGATRRPTGSATGDLWTSVRPPGRHPSLLPPPPARSAGRAANWAPESWPVWSSSASGSPGSPAPSWSPRAAAAV